MAKLQAAVYDRRYSKTGYGALLPEEGELSPTIVNLGEPCLLAKTFAIS